MFFQGFLQFTLEALLLTNVDVELYQFPFACFPCIAVLSQKKKTVCVSFFITFYVFFGFLKNHFVVCRLKGVDALGCTDFMRFLFLMHYFCLRELYSREKKPFPGLHRKAQLSLDTRRFGMMYITSLHLPPQFDSWKKKMKKKKTLKPCV